MSDFRLMDLNWVTQSQTVITASSESPDFRAENLRDERRGKVWRSNETGTFVVTAASNDKIDFDEGSGTITATVAPGTFTSTTLSAAIKSALESIGSETYSVSQSGSTGKFTITSDTGGTFELLWATGGSGSLINVTIGFPLTDQTGSLTYTGPIIAIHFPDENIVFDLATIEEVDSVALLFDPIVKSQLSSNAIVKIQANGADSWAAPAISEVITIDSTYDNGLHFFTSDESYRYWRLVIEDPKNALLFVSAGVLFLANSTQFSDPSTPNIGFTTIHRDQTRKQRNEFGHEFADTYPNRTNRDYKFSNISNADSVLFEEIFKKNGNRISMGVALDTPSDLFDVNRFFIYGKYRGNFKMPQVFNNFWNVTLPIEETM